MVDFQERDTTRGLSGDEGSRENGSEADDGEAELDEVRQQLEERPSEADDDQEGDDEETEAAEDDESEDEEPAAQDHEEEAGEDEAADQADEDEAADQADGDEAAEPADEEGSDDGEPAAQDRGEAADHGDDHAGGHDHGHHAADREQLGAAVVTVSSSRTMDDDPSGDYLVSSLIDAGHDVVTRELIADDYDGVQHTVDTLVRRSDVDVVVTTGGTGVTPDDRTIEAVRPLFEKELPGFGELFRRLSVEEIGARVVATRATAGVADGVPVFCLPGSTNAVQLGVEEIIVDVAPHLAGLADPHDDRAHGGHEHDHSHDDGHEHDHGHAGHDHAHDDDHEHPVE